MSVDHWMMFGTFAQQDVFAYPSPTSYKGVVINANMVAWAPAGIAAFLHEKTAADTTYLIDPQTHAFQHDTRKIANRQGKPKASVAVLAEAYGKPVSATVGERRLVPNDFSDGVLLDEFAERCLGFQTGHLKSWMRETDAAKYLDDAEIERPPYGVVAPYFFISETTVDDWLEINIECIERARQHTPAPSLLFACVVLDRGVLVDTALSKRVAEDYARTQADGFLVWVDNFDEHIASRTDLVALVDFVRKLRGMGAREVINLHGGFFSILAGSALGSNALSGVTHGPEFGEFRSVVPVGGGIPIARYYVPQLHARIRYRDAVRFFKEKGWLDSAELFLGNVCDCDECRKTLNGQAENFSRFGEANVRTVKRRGGLVRIDFPTTETSRRCLRHYLQRKQREYIASERGAEDLVRSVSLGYKQVKDVVGPDGVSHLKKWLRALGRDVQE